MVNYNPDECKKFYLLAKDRMKKGFSEEAIFVDKPSGFSEWLKDKYPERKIIKTKSRFSVTCWRCGKEFGGSKCPYCGAYPKR